MIAQGSIIAEQALTGGTYDERILIANTGWVRAEVLLGGARRTVTSSVRVEPAPDEPACGCVLVAPMWPVAWLARR